MADLKKNNTRFDIERDPRNPQDHVPTGYEGTSPDDFTIPSCEIEDVDVALYNLFNEHIGFRTQTVPDGENEVENINKPYVILATGERFALVKRLKPPRNKSKQLMLPAISIRRKSITQSAEDMNSRGMNQFTGNLVIKRRLAKEDRDYQALINKLSLDNLNPGAPESLREQGKNRASVDAGTEEGAFLDSKLGDNIWEIISIPQPQFYTATYEVTFWSTHTIHMNYLIMTFLSAQLPQGKNFRLNTDKGYWFIATVSEDFTSAENLDDFTEEKRVIRYTVQISVKAFLLVHNGPGSRVPIKRTLSAVEISFETVIPTGNVLGQLPRNHKDPFLLDDINDPAPEEAQTQTTDQKILIEKKIYNPTTGKHQVKRVHILEQNQKKGETSYFANGFENLDEFVATIIDKK